MLRHFTFHDEPPQKTRYGRIHVETVTYLLLNQPPITSRFNGTSTGREKHGPICSLCHYPVTSAGSVIIASVFQKLRFYRKRSKMSTRLFLKTPSFFPALSLDLFFARPPLSERLEQASLKPECVF